MASPSSNLSFESSAICSAVKSIGGQAEVGCLTLLIAWTVVTLIFFEMTKKGILDKSLGLLLAGMMSLITIRFMPADFILLYKTIISVILLVFGPILLARLLVEPGRSRFQVAVLLYILMGFLLFVV